MSKKEVPVVKKLSIQQNMLLNTCGSMIRLVCNWLLTVTVVRFSHGFDAAGVLSLSMSVCNMVLPFAEYRLRTIHVTDVSGEKSAGEYLGIRLITTVGSFALGVLYSSVTCSYDSVPVIVIYLCSQLISTFLEGFHAIDQREMRMDYIGISYALQGVLGLIYFCASLVLTDSLLIAVLGMAIINVAVGLFWDIPKTRQFCQIRPVINFHDVFLTLVRLFPIVIANVCVGAVITVPRQYLAATAGASILGIYSSVASPTTVITVGAQYVYTPLLGAFAERFNRNKEGAKSLFFKVVKGILLVGIVCILLFALFGKFALGLIFGSQISAYASLLLPAVICTFITGFSYFTNDLLISIRDYRASLAGNVLATIVSFAITIPSVSIFGSNGVSFCGIVGYGAGTILMLIFLYNDYQKK